MEHAEFIQKWQNLIFTPLDLPQPPCDKLLLREFMQMFPGHNHEDYVKHHVYGKVPVRNHDPDVEYEFFRSFRVVNNILPWYCEVFADMFPDIPLWLSTLPMVPGKRFSFGWISQLEESDDSSINTMEYSNIHVDEPGSVGLRWFLNNTDNNLFFYATNHDITIPEIISQNPGVQQSKKLYHDNLDRVNPWHGIPQANHYFLSDPISINTSADTAFMLGQTKAAHVIKKESHDDKCTFIVEPAGNLEHRWDWQKLNTLIETSIENHPTETIWHEDFCN